jgi:DNA-binding CsgD family transcriptional regulator/tetratricopeptide (TPR) repeat protein
MTPHPSPESVKLRAGRIPLVGRDRELALLRDAIEVALQGNPGVLFLAGEAGIGKSRLLDEAGKIMVARGGRVAIGRCLDERGMPPFVPWLAALGDLDLGDGGIDPFSAVTGPAAVSVSPEQHKLRLFESVVRALATSAREQPLLLVFDDLQWSDESSNQLLRYVATNLVAASLLVLGAYRIEESASNAELARTIDELDRRRLATTVRIDPLDEGATADLLAGLVGSLDPALAAAIHAHAEGNPFFVEEVVRSLADENRLAGAVPAALPLPRGVVAVIQRRLAALGEPCRAALEVAAVGGRDVAVDLLAHESGQEPEQIAALLEEAVRAGLLRPVPAGGSPATPEADFGFAHDRIREAIAAGINPVRRRAIHGRLGTALEALGGPPDDLPRLAALTHHFERARQPDRAATYAERLGDAAMRAHAHAEAARAYRLALDLRAASPDAGVAALHLKLGDALLATGADATASYANAERAYQSAGDRLGTALALRRRGSAHARREEHDLAIACLQAALRIWDDPTPPPSDTEPVAALVELGSILGTSLGRYDEAIAAGRDALARIVHLGDHPALEAGARLALAKTLMRAGDLAAGHAQLAPALTLTLRAGHLDLAAEVAGALANHAYWIGDLDASERYARRRHELAITRSGYPAGDPYALRHARPWLAILALARGEWDTATTLIAEAEGDVRRIDSPEPRAFLRQLAGYIALARGQYESATSLLAESIAGFRQSGPATLAWYLGCLAHAYLAAGDAGTATRVAMETAEVIADIPTGALPRGPALACLGIVAVRTGDRAAARRWYAELRPYTGQHHWVLIDRVLGMLAAFLGDQASAERHFAGAAALAARGGIRPEFALTLAERAAMRGAEGELRDAIALLRSLAMAGEADRFTALLNMAHPPARQYPAGLSEREVAVLALLAQGLTNREIGDRLGIAEKTVTNHLTHIFTKADLDNRAAAVAFALRHGLAT